MADEITPKEEIAVEIPIEPVSEPIQAPEAPTAQIPVSEPLPTPTEIEAEPVAETVTVETKPVETTPEELLPSAPLPEEIPPASSESITEEVKPETSDPIQTESKPVDTSTTSSAPSASHPTEIPENKPESKQETKSEPEQPKIIPVIIPYKSLARELLVKARNMIQFRKRKKLDKVMTLFLKKSKITNDEVEKFMHVSDATATRYLSQLEKENIIKQSGKTGKHVSYSKI